MLEALTASKSVNIFEKSFYYHFSGLCFLKLNFWRDFKIKN